MFGFVLVGGLIGSQFQQSQKNGGKFFRVSERTTVSFAVEVPTLGVSYLDIVSSLYTRDERVYFGTQREDWTPRIDLIVEDGPDSGETWRFPDRRTARTPALHSCTCSQA